MHGPTADAGHDWALAKERAGCLFQRAISRSAGGDVGLRGPKKGGALMLMMLGHAGPVWGLEKKLVLPTLGPSRATSRN